MKLNFCADEHKVFYKLMLSFLMGMARHSQSSQSDKCAVFLQYHNKKLRYEVDLQHDDKHEVLLKIDSIIFDGFCQACPEYPGKFVLSLLHLKKEVRNEVKDLTALAGSNATLTMYYTSNFLPPLNLFLSQYGIFVGIISLFFI